MNLSPGTSISPRQGALGARVPGQRHRGRAGVVGKEGPPFCRLRTRGGEGASRNGPAANYEARVERSAEEKVAAARAAAAVGDTVAAARVAVQWEALRMWRKGVLVEPHSERALRLTWRAWRGLRGASENAVCDDLPLWYIQISFTFKNGTNRQTLL